MEETTNKTLRYRINVKETAKHEKYFDCTVDSDYLTRDEILAESDKLVAELGKRYPAEIVKES